MNIFTWKVAHGIIASEANLRMHHVPIDPRCVRCGYHWVNSSHVLFFCQGVKRAWKYTEWWNTLRNLKEQHPKEILIAMEEKLNQLEFEQFCLKIWGVWKDRCNHIHRNNNNIFTLNFPGSWTDGWLETYQKACSTQHIKLTARTN